MHAACVNFQCAVVDVHTPTGSIRTLTFAGAVAESPAVVAWDHFSLAVAVAPAQGPPRLIREIRSGQWTRGNCLVGHPGVPEKNSNSSANA